MGLDGGIGDPQTRGDLLGGHRRAQVCEDFALARGEDARPSSGQLSASFENRSEELIVAGSAVGMGDQEIADERIVREEWSEDPLGGCGFESSVELFVRVRSMPCEERRAAAVTSVLARA